MLQSHADCFISNPLWRHKEAEIYKFCHCLNTYGLTVHTLHMYMHTPTHMYAGAHTSAHTYTKIHTWSVLAEGSWGQR